MATGNGEGAPDPLSVYLAEIERAPVLDEADEVELARRISAGIEAERARRELIEAHLRLVVSIAREYEAPSLRLLDLIQEGNIGLMRALETFDPARGVRFADVASPLIRQAIERAVTDLSPGTPHEP